MSTLYAWAHRWGVPTRAIEELIASQIPLPVGEPQEKSESATQALVRLEAAQRDIHLWRNNVGAGYVSDGPNSPGAFMRWGLANESRQQNAVIKSGDLIGIRRHYVSPSDVGRMLGVFVSREVKRSGYRFGNSTHEQAQLRWCTMINAYGGDAAIVSGPGSFDGFITQG